MRLYPERIVIVGDQEVIAEHPRATERDHVVYDWQHYVPLIARKPGALRNGAPFADMPEPLKRLSRARCVAQAVIGDGAGVGGGTTAWAGGGVGRG